MEKTQSFYFYSFAPQNLRLNEGANVEATTGNGKERVRRWGRPGGGGGGVRPYMGYIGMCRCEGYGFQAVYSRIG